MRETVIDGYRLILGDRDCHMCRREGFEGQEVAFHHKTCPKCKGTGKRGSGNCRNCKQESWSRDKRPVGTVLDYERPYAVGPCRSCDGKRHKPADLSDYLPEPVMAQLIDLIGVEAAFRGGELSWAEQHLGMLFSDGELMMSLYSVVDYGNAWRRLQTAVREGRASETETSDREAAIKVRVKAAMAEIAAEVAAKLRDDSTQACKVVSKDGVIGEKILVLIAPNGYTVVTRERDAETRAAILSQVAA